LFGVGTSTITRWRQLHRETGSLAPQSRFRRPPAIGPDQAAALLAQVAVHPDATLAEHCARWTATRRRSLSVAVMDRTIRPLGITLKKSPPRQ
jgi:transposase